MILFSTRNKGSFFTFFCECMKTSAIFVIEKNSTNLYHSIFIYHSILLLDVLCANGARVNLTVVEAGCFGRLQSGRQTLPVALV